MLFKSVSTELKDIDKAKGIVKFYFSIFGEVDSDEDIVMKGAFLKTIKENFKRIKHFKNHDRWSAPGVVQELFEDDTGAVAVSKLILDSTLGKDTFAEYDAGAITEHSFGYNVIKSEADEVGGVQVQRLVELKLNEVSSLTAWGAQSMTRTLDVKNEAEVMNYLQKLTRLQKGDFSDEYFKELEIKIAAVQEHLLTLKEPSPPEGAEGTLIEPLDYILANSKMFN